MVSIKSRPGNRYRDSRYPSGVATQMDNNAAIVQERRVSLNADCISGFITAALKSSNEVNIRSAASSKTMSRMKHDEMPLMTRKNGRSERLRFSFVLVSAILLGVDSLIVGTGLRVEFPAEALRRKTILRIGRADLLE